MRYLSLNQQNEFNRAVWGITRQIPYGKVSTYGLLAELAGPPEGIDSTAHKSWGARWAGSAMAACPEDVPWHRVINSRGEISLRKGSGYLKQKALLIAEGVEFDERSRIDLKKFRWDGKFPPLE